MQQSHANSGRRASLGAVVVEEFIGTWERYEFGGIVVDTLVGSVDSDTEHKAGADRVME